MEAPEIVLWVSHIRLLVLSLSCTAYIALESPIPVQLNVGVPVAVPVGERFVANRSWKQETVAVAVHVVVSVIENM